MLEPSPDIVNGIIGKLKTNGMFDEMRRSCLADIDTKPAFQNLKQRVENYVNALLSTETWSPSLNKNQLRTKVRSSVMRSGMLNTGVEHILHQVVDAKMYTEFLPKINDFIADNHEKLLKELTPQQQPEIGNETDKVIGENPVTEGAVQTDSQESDLPQSIKTNSENQEPVSEIPEGAANTLRTLIQSLMTTNIQSLLTIENEEEGGKQAKLQGKSPSISSSQIESFTDEEGEQVKQKHNAVGPQTPDESENGLSSPGGSEDGSMSPGPADGGAAGSSSESEAHDVGDEDLGKIHSDASFDSSGGNAGKSDCEVVVDDGISEGDYESKDETNETAEQYEDKQLNIVNVKDDFGNSSAEDVEVIGLAGNENVAMEGFSVEDEQSLEFGEIAVTAPSDDEETVEVARHSHREKKRKHKKHHRRRRHSTDGDSDVATFSERDSSDEARIEEAEPSKSKSRKKKKKKRSKKVKKIKARESSLDRMQWDSSSEYKRSSLSPPHSDIPQHLSFIPSPLSQPPVRFEDDNRNVKVEPAFMQMTPSFRDPYAGDRGLPEERPPQDNPEHPFPHPQEGMVGYPLRPTFLPRSPHYAQHRHPRFSPPRFPHGPSRFSPPYSRMPYPMRPGSPPPRGRYSPTFEYYHRPMRPRFDVPPRSPPHRRFSPPRPIIRFPGGFPPRGFPPEERFMMRPGVPGPRGMPPVPVMRPEAPGNPMDIRRPPMR